MRPVHRQRFGIAGVRRCSLSSAPASSESAAVRSLCSSWRNGSRQSGGRDHRGLWDGHHPRWLRRRRGASANAPEYPPAIYEQLRAAGPPSFVSAETGASSTNGEEAPRKRRPTASASRARFPPLRAGALGTQRRPRRRASASGWGNGYRSVEKGCRCRLTSPTRSVRTRRSTKHQCPSRRSKRSKYRP